MTRDEAIKTLREDYCGNRIICELYPDQCNREDCEIWCAIKALETQPDGDTISRQSAIDALRVAYWDDKIQSAKDDPCIVDAMTDWAIRQVKALPSAQPEPIKITIDHAPIPDELERLKQAMRNTPVMLFPSTQPEITPDGTLNVSIDADIASVGRILLSQTGTQRGGLYYKDAQHDKDIHVPCNDTQPRNENEPIKQAQIAPNDDLISRKTAIDAIKNIMPTKEGFYEPSEVFCELTQLPSAQPDLSSYSDKLWRNAYERGKAEAQAEIVRCRDCKHNPKLEWFGCPMSHLNEKQRPETAWCWNGERRTDDD